MPNTALHEAEKQAEPWSWLAKYVKNNPVEWWFEGPAWDHRSDCERYEREGFKRTGIGVYSAPAATRRETKIREVCFFYHKYDTSKRVKRVVMDAPWPDIVRRTFEAAASQERACRRLAIIARGGGSISSTWHDKLCDAQYRGDQKAVTHWADKQIAAILSTKVGRKWLLKGKPLNNSLKAPDEPTREYAHRKYEELYIADVRRLGRKKADDKWKGEKVSGFKLESNGDKIAVALTLSWLAVGHKGFPGLCFLSDEVLAQLFGHTLPLPSLLSDRIRGGKFIWAIRKRMGLIQAEILFTGIEEVGDSKWAILDRNGTRTHWISLRPNKSLPPKL